MQDAYSAMMGQQQRTSDYKPDPGLSFKSYNRQSSISPSTVASSSSYYHGMQYGSTSFPSMDNYPGSMPLSSSTMGADFTPLPAHMQGGQSSQMSHMLNSMSRTYPHLHMMPGANDGQSSGHDSQPGMGLPDMSSPLPSTSTRASSVSPEGHSGHSDPGHMSGDSPINISASKDFSSDNNSEKSGDNKGSDESFLIPPKKRAFNTGTDDPKDETYWDKRKKNNDSAKRSREARRMKEEQIALRVVYLEQENLQLRTEVSLLKTEIEKLRCMLYNS